MFLLDTDTLTLLLNGHARVAQQAQQAEVSGIATTVITRAEMLRGRIDQLLKADTTDGVLRAQERLHWIEARFAERRVIPFDAAAGAVLESLVRVRGLRRIGRADLLIASIALAQHATLVTRNLRHFQRVPGLTLANWAD